MIVAGPSDEHRAVRNMIQRMCTAGSIFETQLSMPEHEVNTDRPKGENHNAYVVS